MPLYDTRLLLTNNFSTISRGGSVFGNFPIIIIIIIIPHGETLRGRQTRHISLAPQPPAAVRSYLSKL